MAMRLTQMKQPSCDSIDKKELWLYTIRNPGVARNFMGFDDDSSAHEKMELLDRYQSLWTRVAGIPVSINTGDFAKYALYTPMVEWGRMFMCRPIYGAPVFIIMTYADMFLFSVARWRCRYYSVAVNHRIFHSWEMPGVCMRIVGYVHDRILKKDFFGAFYMLKPRAYYFQLWNFRDTPLCKLKRLFKKILRR